MLHQRGAGKLTPAGDVLGLLGAWASEKFYSSNAFNTNMNVSMIQPSGRSQPHKNRQPYQDVNLIIALNGIYPPELIRRFLPGASAGCRGACWLLHDYRPPPGRGC